MLLGLKTGVSRVGNIGGILTKKRNSRGKPIRNVKIIVVTLVVKVSIEIRR